MDCGIITTKILYIRLPANVMYIVLFAICKRYLGKFCFWFLSENYFDIYFYGSCSYTPTEIHSMVDLKPEKKEDD